MCRGLLKIKRMTVEIFIGSLKMESIGYREIKLQLLCIVIESLLPKSKFTNSVIANYL